MKKTEDAIVAYLETYGQPQSYEAIRETLDSLGYKSVERTDVEALVDAKMIRRVVDGDDGRGGKMVAYAPRSFKG